MTGAWLARRTAEKTGLFVFAFFAISSTARSAPPPEPYDVRIPDLIDVPGTTAKHQWAKLGSRVPLTEDKLAVDSFVRSLKLSPEGKQAMEHPLSQRALALILAFQPPEGMDMPFTALQLGSILTSPYLNPARIPQLLTDVWILMFHPGIKPVIGSLANGPKEDVTNPKSRMGRQITALTVAAEQYEVNGLKSILPKVEGNYVDMTIRHDQTEKIVFVFSRTREQASDAEIDQFGRAIARHMGTAERAKRKLVVVFAGHFSPALSKLLDPGVEIWHKPYGKRAMIVRR